MTKRKIRPEPEFYTLAHLSRAAPPGSRVLGARAPRGLTTVAFRQPGGAIGVFLHNGTGTARAVRVQVGTATFHDPRAPQRVHHELAHALASRGFPSIHDAIGIAHTRLDPQR